jgi:hypothetical protein
MKVTQDHFKQDVTIGDILLHYVKNRIQYVIVYGMRVDRYGHVILNVHSARKYMNSKQFYTYKTHIKSDSGIVKVDKDVPEDVKRLLYGTIGKHL